LPIEYALTILSFGVAFTTSILFGPGVIAVLKRRGMGQIISDDGPQSHKSKAGTPTMGGLIILAGVFAAVLAAVLVLQSRWVTPFGFRVMRSYDLLAVLMLMVGYALIGMVDDYLTVRPVGGVRGIASKPKAAAQILLAVAFVAWIMSHRPGEFFPALMVAGRPVLSEFAFWVFAVLYIAGMANFVNITDGLDGLVSGLTAIVCVAMIACTLLAPGGVYRDLDPSLYALLPAIAGACVAFLWYNTNPAKVFMGDTGALAIGVALPAIAILSHREILLIVVGLVFVLDGLSSAIQWAVFKFTRITTGTGRRVFKKSPIHHHFELSGWMEQTVVVRFWILGAIAALIGFAGAVCWRLW